MNDPKTFWLTVTNVLLGLAVVVLILGVVTGVLCDFVTTLRKRRSMVNEMDREIWRLFHEHRRH
jgi:hypothetical protein